MVTQKIDKLELYFDPKVDSWDEIKERVLSAYEKNRLFFDCSLINKHTIHIIYSREKMNAVLNMKTESWLVGSTTKDGIIYIFSPKIFSKVSSHPVSNFDPILTHELAHIFTNEIFGFSRPVWLREGIAGYVAEQYRNKRPKNLSDFEKLNTKEDWNKHPNYTQAFCFTAFLIKKLGRGKFLKFIGKISQNNNLESFSSFSKSFTDYFNISFEQVVLDWQKKVPSQ